MNDTEIGAIEGRVWIRRILELDNVVDETETETKLSIEAIEDEWMKESKRLKWSEDASDTEERKIQRKKKWLL